MFTTYILQSIKFDKIYIGQTSNIEKRLERHNKKRVRSTKAYAPYKVIFSRNFSSRSESMRFEKKLKSYKSKDYILRLIEEGEI
jgi:putative endonuclease